MCAKEDRIDMDRLRAALRAQAPLGGSDMTRLCALRAHLRGRMHFAPGTNLAERCWIDRVPVPRRLDPSLPGGWAYEPITPEVVEAWVAPLREQFAAGAALPDEERAVG